MTKTITTLSLLALFMIVTFGAISQYAPSHEDVHASIPKVDTSEKSPPQTAQFETTQPKAAPVQEPAIHEPTTTAKIMLETGQDQSTTEEMAHTDETTPEEQVNLPELPGKEIHYQLALTQSDFFDFKGQADSELGSLGFTSKLTPSNEVFLDITILGEDQKLMKATIDLASFTMELDGAGAILNQDQKTMMAYTAEHLRQELIKQYQDEIPHHSLLTVQMLMYWSKSPEGYSHTKRDVVSNH